MVINQVTRVVLGATSSLGIRPYDEGGPPRHLDRAPGALRTAGVVDAVRALDLGDVSGPAYRDAVRPPRAVRNEQELVAYSRLLGQRVGDALDLPGQPLVVLLGGDCSIVLGSLLGASSRGARIGLVYIDAHADFATPEESVTGSAASMCLAMAVGRGDSPLSMLAGVAPLVRATDVALIGRRDGNEPAYGHAALAASGILDIGCAELIERGPLWAAEAALARVATDGVDGFWIHLDADVLDSAIMPAVDSPEPGGPSLENVATLVRTLTRHPAALGLQLTIYDPALDADGACAARLVDLLASAFADASTEVR